MTKNRMPSIFVLTNHPTEKVMNEVAEGVILDYDHCGKLIGLEILDASRKLPSKFQSALKQNKLPLSVKS